MKKVRLIVKRDRETGELGLMVKGTPMINYPMVANSGLLIAHDLLEHVNGVKHIGSIGDELLAMGGVWYTRGQHNDIQRFSKTIYTPHESVASEIANMGKIVLEGGVPYRVPVPKTRKHELDDDFKKILECAYKDLRGELDDFRSVANEVGKYLGDCLHFMRRGYNLAKRKYDQCEVNAAFWTIAQEVDKYVKGIDFEGQEYHLTYDVPSCYAHMEECYDGYY